MKLDSYFSNIFVVTSMLIYLCLIVQYVQQFVIYTLTKSPEDIGEKVTRYNLFKPAVKRLIQILNAWMKVVSLQLA